MRVAACAAAARTSGWPQAAVKPACHWSRGSLPARAGSGFAADLAVVGAADPELVAAELTHLAGRPVAMPGPGRAERVALLGALAADPQAALPRITTALDCYWRAAIAPDWPRIRSLLAGDVAFRSR